MAEPNKSKFYLESTKTSEKIYLNSEIVTKLKSDKSLSFKIRTDKKVELHVYHQTQTLYNGYAILPDATYLLKEGDILTMADEEVYKLCSDTRKRKSTDVSDSEPKEPKKMKLAPIFSRPKAGIDAKSSFTKIEGTWEIIDKEILVFTPTLLTSRSKLACFDLDGTLIKPKDGRTFPEDHNDWELFTPTVARELAILYNDGFKIVIFTNQSPLGMDSSLISLFKEKLGNILNTIRLPIQVFAAMKKTFNRKPTPGMWNTLMSKFNDDVEVNKDECFYVGDAAGRPKEGKKRADHSNADRLFALNVGLTFKTPEEFFFKARVLNFKMPPFNPQTFTSAKNEFELSLKTEVIIMVGSPASGKSHFCRTHLTRHGYAYINRDSLKTWQACIQLLEKTLQSERSAVIDNTNRDTATRAKYIQCAKKFNIPVRCFVMDVDKQQAFHNNKFRQIVDKEHAIIQDMVIHTYYKYFEEPKIDEGFTEIVKLGIELEFEDAGHEDIYKMFLLEK